MRYLNRRQMDLLDELFEEKTTEDELLAKYKVNRGVYENWFKQKKFADEFARRIDASYRESELIIARYTPVAAKQLIKLTQSKKEEVSRKACLDILSLPKASIKLQQGEQTVVLEGMSEETAGRLLEAMAKTKV